MSIMTELTAKGTRESGFNSIVISPLTPIVFSPLGVLIPLVLVAPSRFVLLGVVSAWSRVIIVWVFPFLLVIIRLMGWIFRIQLFKSMHLLNGRGLNKFNAIMWLSMWRSHSLWGTRKWKVQMVLWQRSIGCIGR